MSNTSLAEIEAVKDAAPAIGQIAGPTLQPIAAHAFDRSSYKPDEHRRGPRIRRAKNATKLRALTVSDQAEPWVHLHAANVRALGPCGAIMVDYVAQWSRASSKGKAQLKVRDCHGGYWLACSYAHIEQQTGLNKSRAEDGITACVDAGVLETTVMEFQGERSLHVRIAPAEGAQIVPWPLIVGEVTGEEVKLAGVLKNDSQAAIAALLPDQSGYSCFPIQQLSKTTAKEKTNPAAVASLAADQAESNTLQEETRPNRASPDEVKKAKSSYYEDYKRGVESVGGFVPPPTNDVLSNVKAASNRLKEDGRLTYAQVHEFFFLVGVHADYLQCSWKHFTSAKDYDGHGMPVGEDVLAYVVGSKMHGKNRLWVALDAIGHHLTKEQPAADKPAADVAAGGKPTVKKMKMAGATQPKPAELAPALESSPPTPPTSVAPCAGMAAPKQAAVALIDAVPVQLGFDLINPNACKRQTMEEAAAWPYMDLLRVDRLAEVVG